MLSIKELDTASMKKFPPQFGCQHRRPGACATSACYSLLPQYGQFDHIASTEGMIRYCKQSKASEFILGTEVGILHRMRKEMPEKKFYPASEMSVCNTMKMITLTHVRNSLSEMKHKVTVPKETADKARKAIERMLEIK
jgi:quinolinate synthase